MTLPVGRVRDALQRAGLLVEARGELPATVAGIADDSRRVVPGSLFVAVRGSVADGHDYLGIAGELGAVMAIVEDASRTGLPLLVVRDARLAAAVAASEAYNDPGGSLTITAITGTNGKTTTASILRHLMDGEGGSAASIGTLGVLVGSEGVPIPGGSGLTTPGPVELQRVLRLLVDAGVRHVAMEVSSHSVDQRRIAGLGFAAAVFTNLTRDHLDYHLTMEAYLAAKASLVGYIAPGGKAVVNADDPAWYALPPVASRVTFGLAQEADVRAADIALAPGGSDWELVIGAARFPVSLPLAGDFNVSNALAAAAAAWSLGREPATIASRLGTLPQVPGRLERLTARPAVYRDYAHTPDALNRALRTVRGFVPDGGRVIVVFGCGGDRDRGKRPQMGRIAAELADLSVITSDNPRTEDPERILDDIEEAMGSAERLRIEDRRDAIAAAIASASAECDVVLLAGKGHEDYQIRGTVSYPFDERIIVGELIGAAPAS